MSSTPGHQRTILVLLTAVCAAASLVGLQMGVATAGPPAPAYIVVTDVTSGLEAPDGTPSSAVPSALVEAGEPFTVHVAFFSVDNQPASFNKDTALVVTAVDDEGQPVAVDKVDWLAPRGAVTAALDSEITTATNEVRLTVSLPGSKKAPVTGTAPDLHVFDVLKEIKDPVAAEPGTRAQGGIGGNGDCAQATAESPVCGVVILPNGARSSVLLSLGACDGVPGPGELPAYAPCDETGSVVQVLADLEGLYDARSPATVVMKCDKVLCPGGAINSYSLNYSSQGNSDLQRVGACPAKNTIGTGQEVCVDYVQSQRDGSGDTHLYLLFTKDARVSWR
jgi:hypothetical protein